MRRKKLFCFLLCALIPSAFAQVHPTSVRVLEDYMRPQREKRVDPAYPQAALKAGISGIVELYIWIGQTGDIQNVQLIGGNPVLGSSAIEAVKQWHYKPYLLNGSPMAVSTKVTLNYKLLPSGEGVVRDAPGRPLEGPTAGTISSSPGGATPPGTTTLSPAHPVKISRRLADSLILKRVSPEYPAEAKSKHVEGDVMLRIIIDQDGDVYSATSISGDPLLTQAAVDAVKKWKYKPYQLAGRAADADTTVIVNFRVAP
jgi:TonB family protein